MLHFWIELEPLAHFGYIRYIMKAETAFHSYTPPHAPLRTQITQKLGKENYYQSF